MIQEDETREDENLSRIGTFINICAVRLFFPACFALVCIVLCVVVRQWIPADLLHWADTISGILALVLVFGTIAKTANAWTDSIRKEVSKASSSAIIGLKILIILVVEALLLAYGYTMLLKLKYPGIQQRGEFGDAFGALNALASTVALIGLWLTVWLQYRQMKDDRQRYIEDRRVEEERKVADRLEINKRNWPAVVVSDIRGRVSLVGVNQNGEAAFRFDFGVVQRNCSTQVLINVIQSFQTSKSSDNTYLINLFANIERYLDANKTISKSAIFYERSIAGDLTTDALSDCDNRIVHVNIFLCTIQKQYYFISHQFKVCVSRTEPAIHILAGWIDVLSTIKGRLAKRLGCIDFNTLLKQELAVRKISLTDFIDLEFIPLPDKYQFIEIPETKYMAALNEKKTPSCE